jgi:hypothetical protein
MAHTTIPVEFRIRGRLAFGFWKAVATLPFVRGARRLRFANRACAALRFEYRIARGPWQEAPIAISLTEGEQ